MVAALERVEAELARIGLLLEHDKLLPSATALIAGVPISGSWWGHARGHEIYALLSELEGTSGALCLKLVNAKRTYVHPRLYGAFFALIAERRAAALATCSPLAAELFALTEQQRLVPMAIATGLAPSKECSVAARELEDRLLVYVGSEHTASGKHEKTLEAWSAWQARLKLAPEPQTSEQARQTLRSALERLGQGLKQSPKMALLENGAAY